MCGQTHTHTHTHTHAHKHTHTHTHTHICTHKHTNTHTHSYTNTHARTHAHIHTHTWRTGRAARGDWVNWFSHLMCVWHDSYICATYLVHMRTFIHVFQLCDMNYIHACVPFVWHDSHSYMCFICVTCLTFIDMTHVPSCVSYVWHVSHSYMCSICATYVTFITWLSDMTSQYVFRVHSHLFASEERVFDETH